MMTAMLGLLPLLALGLLIYTVVLTVATFRGLTRPARRGYAWAVSKGLPGEPSELSSPRRFDRFEFSRDGVAFVGWSIDGGSSAGPVVVLTHGWADSKVGGLTRAEAVAPCASRVIAWDLRGHGESGGTSTLGLEEKADLLALIETLESDRPVVLFGWSLGAGVSIAAAVECDRVEAVIAESPYRLATTPARNVLLARFMPWRINLPLAMRLIGSASAWRRFDRCEIASRLRVPLLVLHGADDPVAPVDDGRSIAEAGRGELVTLPAGHNDIWTGAAATSAQDAVRAFLSRL